MKHASGFESSIARRLKAPRQTERLIEWATMDPFVPMERRPRRAVRPSRQMLLGRAVLFGAIFLALILATAGVDYYTDWLWFSALGYLPLFTTVLGLQVQLFALGFAVFGLIF